MPKKMMRLLWNEAKDDSIPQGIRELHVQSAAYDLINWFQNEESLISNITINIQDHGKINSTTSFELNKKISYYGRILNLKYVDFEIKDKFSERIICEGPHATASQKYCFLFRSNSTSKFFEGCFTLWT